MAFFAEFVSFVAFASREPAHERRLITSLIDADLGHFVVADAIQYGHVDHNKIKFGSGI